MSDERILIVGAARSGVALARLLRSRGGDPVLADGKLTRVALPADLGEITFHSGPFHPEWLNGITKLVISPGVPGDAPVVRGARERQLPVSGEIEEAGRLAGAPVVAITGTNGKSTTTTLISLLLESLGYKAPAGGNLGRPFSELVLEVPDADFYVVEISSFQCETLSRFRPFCAGLLNLTPDHLDRYSDLESYYGAKLKLFARMGPDDHIFLPDDPTLERRLDNCPARRHRFSLEGDPGDGAWYRDGDLHVHLPGGGEGERLMGRDQLLMVGQHNLANALAALAAIAPIGFDREAFGRVLGSFPGLPHRMEDLGPLGDLRCYNDSKATNVEATLASLGGLEGSILLIAGGKDKGGDFQLMAAQLPGVRRIYGVGEAGGDIVRAFGERGVDVGDMAAAVALARREGEPGELLILSPACASYDQYANFEQRGDHLRQLVKELQC